MEIENPYTKDTSLYSRSGQRQNDLTTYLITKVRYLCCVTDDEPPVTPKGGVDVRKRDPRVREGTSDELSRSLALS